MPVTQKKKPKGLPKRTGKPGWKMKAERQRRRFRVKRYRHMLRSNGSAEALRLATKRLELPELAQANGGQLPS